MQEQKAKKKPRRRRVSKDIGAVDELLATWAWVLERRACLDQAVAVAEGQLLAVPFELENWPEESREAADRYREFAQANAERARAARDAFVKDLLPYTARKEPPHRLLAEYVHASESAGLLSLSDSRNRLISAAVNALVPLIAQVRAGQPVRVGAGALDLGAVHHAVLLLDEATRLTRAADGGSAPCRFGEATTKRLLELLEDVAGDSDGPRAVAYGIVAKLIVKSPRTVSDYARAALP